MNNRIKIDNVYSLELDKSTFVSSLIILNIYEFDNKIYSMKVSPQIFSSILTTCSYLEGSKSFKTVLGDDIILNKESKDIILFKINKINLRLSVKNIEDLLDNFVKIISN